MTEGGGDKRETICRKTYAGGNGGAGRGPEPHMCQMGEDQYMKENFAFKIYTDLIVTC